MFLHHELLLCAGSIDIHISELQTQIYCMCRKIEAPYSVLWPSRIREFIQVGNTQQPATRMVPIHHAFSGTMQDPSNHYRYHLIFHTVVIRSHTQGVRNSTNNEASCVESLNHFGTASYRKLIETTSHTHSPIQDEDT